MQSNEQPSLLPLDPRKRDHADYAWQMLRLLCRGLGGWSFIREDRRGVITDCTPPFFRFEENDCPGAGEAALLFKETAGVRLAELGVDFEIDIEHVVRPDRWDVTVSFSVRLCENDHDEYALERSTLCEECSAKEAARQKREDDADEMGSIRGGR